MTHIDTTSEKTGIILGTICSPFINYLHSSGLDSGFLIRTIVAAVLGAVTGFVVTKTLKYLWKIFRNIPK